MEIFARERAESEKAALEQRVRELQDQLEQRAVQDRASEEPRSQHGSNMRQNLNTKDDEDNQGEEDRTSGDDYLDAEDDQNFLDQIQGAKSSQPAGDIATGTSRPAGHIATATSRPAGHIATATSRPAGHIATATSQPADAPRSDHDALVILLSYIFNLPFYYPAVL
ncbi:uncharacterized protein LOC112891337 [Panicum hallii]|uniref:uncharacterized protein LOC112891337 n=1 Tax=Panicum hallii TaxID=206008 RepID=UPI000DF4F155|nr:uncharacterized protein LOC112891337 [Panicum hallii]